MRSSLKKKINLDPSEWILLALSWLIYFGGLIIFFDGDNSWVLIVTGALPVLITGWTSGMAMGGFAALLSISIHFIIHFFHPSFSTELNIFLLNHLIGFAALTVAGMLVGHLRDLQNSTYSQLAALKDNNQQLMMLSQLLETTNLVTTELISTKAWVEKLPDLIREIGTIAELDHIFLLQLTGYGSANYSGIIHHFWSSQKENDDQAVIQEQLIPSFEIINWIKTADNNHPFSGNINFLSPETQTFFNLNESGEFIIYPIFANTSLWGFIGFETEDRNKIWDQLERKTYKSIAQTLGSTFYKKLIEDNLNLRAKELDSLQKTSMNVSSSDHLDSGLHTVLSQILELSPAYDTNIYLKDNHELKFFLSLGANQQQSLPFTHSGELEVSRIVADTKQDLFISDISTFNSIEPGIASQQEGLISLALVAASEVIGILNIWFPSFRKFPREEKTILRLLADQAATAILNMQFLQVERYQRILADSLRKANLQLSNNLELKQVLENILEQILMLVSARDSHILLYDGKVLEFGAVAYAKDVQRDPVHSPDNNSIFYQTAQNGECVLIPDIQEEKNLQASWKTGSLISLPLIFHKKVIGVMNVTFFEPGELDEQHFQVLNLLSNQAAIAINNARTFEAEREQRKLAQALQHTGRIIQSSLDLEVVMDHILAQIATVIQYHSANLMLVDDGIARVVRLQGYQNLSEEYPEDPFRSPFKVSRFSTLEMMTETKNPLIIPDTTSDPQWVKTRTTEKIQSWAGAPILDGDQVIGFLSLNNQNRHYYQPEHAETLTAFASQASIALKHARLFQQSQQHARELGALHEATSTLVTTLKLDDLPSKILEGAVKAIPATEFGALFLVDEDKTVLLRKAEYGKGPSFNEQYSLDANELLPIKVFLENRPEMYNDQDDALQSIIAAPLPTQKEVLGVIILAGHDPGKFTENDLTILTNIAATTASAIRNAQLHKEIEDLAITDPLTKIFNRRGLEQWGQYEIDRAIRFDSPLSAIFFDLDNFKNINDTYGHEIGDQVLEHVVLCSQEVIRKIDIFARIGGEEFIIILPETALPVAVKVAERIRKNVTRSLINANSHQIQMTISLGVSELSEEINDLVQLINAADHLMYQAKQSGRNTTASALSNF
ncbi:MAG: GAF domain-containing protein [Anaerolineales bacterium]|nr:GAF domain-containing protein [Anaerolineales bacterium]